MKPRIKSQFGWAADCHFGMESVFMKIGDIHKGYKLIEGMELVGGVHQRRLKLVEVKDES